MKKRNPLLALLLPAMLLAGAAGCATAAAAPTGGASPNPYESPAFASAGAANLMEGIPSGGAAGKPADTAFIASMADFSVELFKKSAADKESSLVSPLSVMLALSMTANGADNETRAQMEGLLGGGIPLADLNEYLCRYLKELPCEEKARLTIANSIWLRDDDARLRVEPGFLQKNADYYNAAAYKSAFDPDTLDEINAWVNANTDGMIDKILDEINPDAVIYLINAIVFDAEWETAYNKNGIHEDIFTGIGGDRQNALFMYSEEHKYLDDGKASGFMKPYANGHYSFAALLPNEGLPIEAYIKTLTGTGLANTIKNAESTLVDASMPKFGYEYEIRMNDALIALGIPDAFDGDRADFNKMAASSYGNIYIGEVLHKTFISVDELGTKAGAVTKVEMEDIGAPEAKTVRLDRPFVFAIVENVTGLPVFIGTVMTVPSP